MAYRAVFIDRDGTINVDVKYLNNPEGLRMYPMVAEGIKLLNKSGLKVVVVTNQSGIARGLYTHETVAKIHERMVRELTEKGASVDAIYYCPHHPDDNCKCRKPKTGLFEQAIKELDIDSKRSFVVGDMMLDIEAGYKMGCTTILVPEKGHEEERSVEEKNSPVKPNYKCSDFYSAVLWILSSL